MRFSFAVHLASGAFYCFGCGAKGGDVLQFVRRRHGLTFVEAARHLGVWDGAPTPATLRRIAAEKRDRERQAKAAERQRSEWRERRLLLRDILHKALGVQRKLCQQLDEIHRVSGDEEPYWEMLEFVVDYVREWDYQYCRAAGLEAE